jgi:hypothetical protein
MTGPPAATPSTTSLGATRQTRKVYEVRWPDGRRFDSRRQIGIEQAQLLVNGKICEWVRSATGIPRYLRILSRTPGKAFLSMLAQANFTTTRTGNLHEHIENKQRGF